VLRLSCELDNIFRDMRKLLFKRLFAFFLFRIRRHGVYVTTILCRVAYAGFAHMQALCCICRLCAYAGFMLHMQALRICRLCRLYMLIVLCRCHVLFYTDTGIIVTLM